MELMTVKEVAKCLRCSVTTVRRYARGLLPSYRIRSRILFKKQDVEDLLENHRIGSHFPKRLLTSSSSLYMKQSGGVRVAVIKNRRCVYGTIYQRKSGGHWTMDFYDENGDRVQKVIPHAATKEEAVFALQKEVSKVFDRLYGIEQRRRKIGFREFAGIYEQDYIRVVRRNFSFDLCRLKKLISYFRNTELREITPLMIERFRKSRFKEGNAKSTTNRYLALMKKLFNLAISENFAEENPVCKVRLYSEKDTFKERILTEEEEQKLVRNSAEYLRPIIAAAVYSGMRKSEILNLKWNQIDFDSKQIRVEKTKSGRVRFIPLSGILLAELLTLRRENPFVFANPETKKPYVDLKKGFKAACEKAGIEGLRFHDLRHTFASRLVERGVDVETVKELLGHSSILITQRYLHSSEERKRKAVEKLDRIEKRAKFSDTEVTKDKQSGLIN